MNIIRRLNNIIHYAVTGEWMNATINGIPAKITSSSESMGQGSDYNADIIIPSYGSIYRTIWVVQRAVNAIADAIASTTLVIYDSAGNDVSKLPYFRALYKPNIKDTQNSFSKITEINLDIQGRVFWHLFRDNRNMISEIYNLIPANVQIIPDAQEYIKGYKYFLNGKWIEYSPDEIFFFGNINPESDYYGLSRISAVANDIELKLSSIKYNRLFFKNSARPDGFIEIDKDANVLSESIDRIDKEFKLKHTSLNNMHKTIVLDPGMKFTPASIPPKDIEFLQLQKSTKEDIAAIFGVPPILLNDYSDSSVLANAETEMRLFWENTILPRLNDRQELYNSYLLPIMTGTAPGQYNAIFDISSIYILQQSKNMLLERMQKGFMTAAVTPNEIRSKVFGENPINSEAANSVYLPFSVIAVGTVKPEIKKRVDVEPRKIYKYTDLQLRAIKTGFDNFRARREKTAEGKLVLLFKDQRRATLEKFDKIANRLSMDIGIETRAVEAEALFNIGEEDRNLKVVIAPWMRDVIKDAALFTLEAWDLSGDINILDPMVEQMLGMRMREFSRINQTTMEAIQQALIKGFAENESIAQLRDRIEEVFVEATTARAQSIAITETTYAQNAGIQAAMTNAGVKNKMWMHADYGEPRPEHLAMNGKVIPANDMYFVGGESMMFPGSGKDPANNINCHCTSIPTAEEVTLV